MFAFSTLPEILAEKNKNITERRPADFFVRPFSYRCAFKEARLGENLLTRRASPILTLLKAHWFRGFWGRALQRDALFSTVRQARYRGIARLHGRHGRTLTQRWSRPRLERKKDTRQ
jgi:hypothetical protein